MFEFIRTHQRLMQFLLLLIIIPAFVIGFGLQSYTPGWNDPNMVAKVCGAPVTQQEYLRAQEDYMATLRSQLGPNFRSEFFDNAETRATIVDRLVSQRVLACNAVKRNIIASDQQLQQAILREPRFQQDGVFNKDLYNAMLLSNGMTPAMMESQLRQNLAIQAISSGVFDSSFAPQSVEALIARAQDEQREVQDFVIKPDAYTAEVKLAPEAAKAYYDANQREFQVPPQMRAEYLVLSAEALSAGIAVKPDEIKVYYEQNLSRYGVPEERQARHILIAADEKAPAAEIAAARAKAQGLLAELKAAPGKFPELAKQFSADPGSAAKGGELDFAPRNGAFVKPFEDALYSLKQGEISDLVQTNYGFHIIQLMAIKPSTVKPFEEVRAGIEKDWKLQRGQKLYAESTEAFADLVYTQPDSLKPAADKYKLTVQSTALFSRAAPPKDLANAKLLEKLFGDEALKSKRNTEAVEIAPGVMASARVVEYKPQTIVPFDDAKAQIVAKLTRREAQVLARKDGEAKLKAAQANPDAVSFGPANTLSRGKPEGIVPEVLKAVMSAPAAKLPVVVGVELADGGYGLFRINKVSQPEKPDPAAREGLKSALTRSQAQADFSSYLAGLRQAAKVELHLENLEKKPAN